MFRPALQTNIPQLLDDATFHPQKQHISKDQGETCTHEEVRKQFGIGVNPQLASRCCGVRWPA
jgi:hypothetical protein